MMKIGDFALLTGIPVRTIRYYSDIGLLSPASVDNENNYRYYGIKQLLEIKRIIELKDTGFTLSEIQAISDNDLTGSDLMRLLKSKLNLAIRERNQIEMKIKNIENKIKDNDIKKSKMKNASKITIGTDMKSKMDLSDIKVPPFNNTLMGMIKGVADYYETGLSDAMLYGLTGQAFMMNIHKELCPSGPYCWNRGPFYTLLGNIGIKMTDLGFYSADSSEKDRTALEGKLIGHINSKKPCGLVNMEYQLITHFDDTGFILSQPWKGDFPPGHLAFGTWEEFGDDIFANFFTFDKIKRVDIKSGIIKSLNYALDLTCNPSSHTSEPYFTGIAAYDAFIEAVDNGFGSIHGNWWNATVWGECRGMASKYFYEISGMYNKAAPLANKLGEDYKLISAALLEVSDRKMPVKPKIELLKEAKSIEQRSLDKITEMLEILKSR